VGGAITSNYWAVAQILLYVDVDACTMQSGLSERSGGLWHTVVFLPLALRQRTRTRLGFQGTTDLFSHKERKAEMQGFKPPSPHHWVLRPVACGGLKPEYCHNSLEATTWLSAHPRLHHVFIPTRAGSAQFTGGLVGVWGSLPKASRCHRRLFCYRM
jgi:hypothetical protein